jgi:maltose O-acetyltransferase
MVIGTAKPDQYTEFSGEGLAPLPFAARVWYCSNMKRLVISRLIDPFAKHIARRIEYQKLQELNSHPRVIKHPTARFQSEAEIHYLHKEPGAIRIGAHSLIRGELLVFFDGGRIEVGEWSFIGPGARVWAQSSVVIGSNVMIAHGVNIHDTNSHPTDWRERERDTQAVLSGTYLQPTQTISKPVVIEDNAWIGFNAAVMKGVRVGRGAIVAAHAIVTRDVPAFSIVAGNPASVIRQLAVDETA